LRPAQIGLLIATPLIIAVAVSLHRQGALGLHGVIAVAVAAIAAATVLYMSH
jgi:hypothetical protein